MGDSTDGYSGCPGVGKVKAERLLESLHTPQEMWEAVVAAYEKAGLSEAEAITQARVARILRASDYDFVNKSVKLWSPDYETALH
jgi:DNA polymerase-1